MTPAEDRRRYDPFVLAGRLRALVLHHADPLGHAVGLLSGARPRFRDGCFHYVSDRGLARLILSRRGYAAITFGHVIVSAGSLPATIWRHELRHVRQYERMGCAFLPAYLLWYRRRGYARHPLERDASRPTTLFDA